jgi:adenine-specific DNA-methyltransferase
VSVESEIDALVARARATVGDGDVRSAFAEVLSTLRISPAEADAWRDGTDIVGAAYERLVSGRTRREQGQFFTPFWAGEVMSGWLFSEPRKLLADPGCGAGGLLIPAARHEHRGEARLLGIDSDRLAIAMARSNRVLRSITALSLKHANFLTEPLGPRPDAIICNPPYSKHQSLDAEEKSLLYASFNKRLKLVLNRRTPLHVLFLVRAIEWCAAGGAIAFITPTGWLDADYGAPIKKFILERAHVEARIVFETKHLFFPGARTTAEITLIQNELRDEPTQVIRLPQKLPTSAAVVDALHGDGGLRVTTQRLDASRPWSRARPRQRGEKLGDLARIRRGSATGCNRFFVISEAERTKLGIPRRQLRACITSPRLVSGDELTATTLAAFDDDIPRWAIECLDPAEEQRDTALGFYLRGDLAGIAKESYLAKQRTLWYGLERRGECPILFTYFNKNNPRFVRNRAGVLPLNTWLIIEPEEGVDPDQLWKRLRKLKRADLSRAARVYGAGLWKLEPSELAQVVLPAEGASKLANRRRSSTRRS